jgi:hypothetical protein
VKANDTTVQQWFAANNSIPLDANSTYVFEGTIITTNGTTSHGLNMQFAAIAGATIVWGTTGYKIAANNQATAQRAGRSTTFDTNRLVTTASTVAGNVVQVTGVIRTTTAGTFAPRIAQSAASGSFTVNAGTRMMVRKLGADTFVDSGEWA